MNGTSVTEAICLLDDDDDDGGGDTAAAAVQPSQNNDHRRRIRNRNKQRRKRQNKRIQNDRHNSKSHQRNNRLDGDVSLWTQRFDQPNGEQECVVIDMCSSSSSEDEEGEVAGTNEAKRTLKVTPPVAAPVESELERKERLERTELLQLLRDKKEEEEKKAAVNKKQEQQKKPPAQSTSATATTAAYLRPVPSYGRTNRALHKASLTTCRTKDGQQQPKQQPSATTAPTGILKRSGRWGPKAPPPAAAATVAAAVETAEPDMISFCDDKASATPLNTSEPEGKRKRNNRWGPEQASSTWLAGTPEATAAVLPNNNNRNNEDHNNNNNNNNNSEAPSSKRARAAEEGGSDAPTLTDSLMVARDMATEAASTTRNVVGKDKEPFVDSKPASEVTEETVALVGKRNGPFDADQLPGQAEGAATTADQRNELPDAGCAKASSSLLRLESSRGQMDAGDGAAASEPHDKQIVNRMLQPKPVGILKKKRRYGVQKPVPKPTSPDVIELLDDSSDEDTTAPIPSVATHLTGSTEGDDPSLPAAHGEKVTVEARGSNGMVITKQPATDQRAASLAAPKRADMSTPIDSTASSSTQPHIINAAHSTSAPTSESDAPVLGPAKPVEKADCLKPRRSAEYYRRIFPDDDPSCEPTFDGSIFEDVFPGHERPYRKLPPPYEFVDHLSVKTIDPVTKLPCWNFVLRSDSENLLYYFEAVVRQSQIPGAGLGAFLTFRGAFRLRKNARDRSRRVRADMVVINPTTKEPLVAVMPNGQKVNVVLKGQHLHGDLVQPRTAMIHKVSLSQTDIREHPAFTKTTDTLRFTGSAANHVWEYNGFSSGGQEGSAVSIGPLGVNLESDYVEDTSILEFRTTERSIDLGIYGPLSKDHLKPDEILNVKSFVYCNEPNDWGFHMLERVNGVLVAVGTFSQVFEAVLTSLSVDITNDFDGKPCKAVTEQLLMYVNEVGYNHRLSQNVEIRETNKAIKFSVELGNNPMRLGEQIELLTNYGCAYEKIRERRGYGYRNITEDLPSNSSQSAQLQRGFLEREKALSTITNEKDLGKLKSQLDFVYKIWDAHSKTLFASMNTSHPVTPKEKQWVAVCRIAWLTYAFREALESVSNKKQTKTKQHDKQLPQPDYFISILDEIDSTASQLFQHALLDSSANVTDNDLRAVRFELMEECLFELRGSMPLVMDDRYYCPLAKELICELCKQFAIKNSCGELDIDGGEDPLRIPFLAAARKAKEQLLSCSSLLSASHPQLQFSSGLKASSQLLGVVSEMLEGDARPLSSFFQHSLVEKGYQAVAHHIFQYHDALCMLGEKIPTNLRVTVPESVVMTTVSCVVHNDLPGLASAPVPTASDQPINVDWYLYWQVIWVVDAFAKVFLTDESHETFLSELCRDLDADISVATFVIERGLRPDISKLKEKLRDVDRHRKETKKKKKKHATGVSRSSLHSPAKLIYEGVPNTKFPGVGGWPPGWTQKTYERTSGASKGGTDHYWFPPNKERRLRSNPEIVRYLESC